MQRPFFPLRLATVLLSILLCTVSGDVTLDQLFIVSTGTTNGGCSQYFNHADGSGLLDSWLEEINFALSSAINAIDNYQTDPKIRAALKTWFGVTSKNKKPAAGTQKVIDDIGNKLRDVLDFFEVGPPGTPKFPLNGNRYLFCASDFLVEQSPDTQALDWQAHDIVDSDGDIVPISNVPIYRDALNEDSKNRVWWSGDLTPVNGYYFSPTGGDYCDILTGPNKDTKSLGLTSDITELEVDDNGQPTRRMPIETVVLCPEAFTSAKHPDSYQAANAAIVAGKNLADVVPKSATLMHEAFHVTFGAGPTGFLQGNEIYDIITCIEKAEKDATQTARRNPENYVFFVSHMFHLYGKTDENIATNWDFKTQTNAEGDKVFGAVALS